jgi:hypothetical protein
MMLDAAQHLHVTAHLCSCVRISQQEWLKLYVGDGSSEAQSVGPLMLALLCPAYSLGSLQVPWLVIFGVLTLVPQTAVCYYLMLAAWVSMHRACTTLCRVLRRGLSLTVCEVQIQNS